MPRKCPLCYTLIDQQELRSCELITAPPIKEGQEIELHLVKREIRTNIIQDEAAIEKKTPRNSAYIYHPGIVPKSRVLLTYDIGPIIDKEREELKHGIWLAKSTQNLYLIPYYENGLNDLWKREEEYKAKTSKIKRGYFLIIFRTNRLPRDDR